MMMMILNYCFNVQDMDIMELLRGLSPYVPVFCFLCFFKVGFRHTGLFSPDTQQWEGGRGGFTGPGVRGWQRSSCDILTTFLLLEIIIFFVWNEQIGRTELQLQTLACNCNSVQERSLLYWLRSTKSAKTVLKWNFFKIHPSFHWCTHSTLIRSEEGEMEGWTVSKHLLKNNIDISNTLYWSE